VAALERTWCDKNVDLGLLTSRISGFLEENYFENVKKEDLPNGHQIFAKDSPFFDSSEYVNVRIEGQSNNFIVRLNVFRKAKKRILQVSPLMLTLLGGGRFFLKELRSQENWLIFERDFWKRVENELFSLVNSAKSSSSG
jgi:hypothetical protein